MKQALVNLSFDLPKHRVGDSLLLSFVQDKDNFVLVYGHEGQMLLCPSFSYYSVVRCFNGHILYSYFDSFSNAANSAIVKATKLFL